MTLSLVSRRSALKGAASMFALAAVAAPASAKPKLARDPFIESLIGNMTLEEKAGQLSIYSDLTRFDSQRINPASDAVTKVALS